MLDEVFGAIAGLFVPGGSGGRDKKLAESFAAGKEVVIEAAVLGSRSYCRTVGCFLRKRSPADAKIVPRFWDVAECRDGETDVHIACAPSHMNFIRAVLSKA